jgi:hypothetical protein
VAEQHAPEYPHDFIDIPFKIATHKGLAQQLLLQGPS